MYDLLDTISRECFRSFSALPNARLVDEHGAFGALTGIPLTFFNGIATAQEPSVGDVIGIFRERACAFRWWVRDAALGAQLAAHGMLHRWDAAGMTLDLAGVVEVPPPRELEIVRGRDERALDDFANVLLTVFAKTAALRPSWLAAYRALGFDDQWAHFVGYLDGAPVATTSLLLAGQAAGIYHVATLQQVRGRGFGSGVTLAALQYARERGAERAALQSSDIGLSVYRRLGFEERCTLSMYEWLPGRS